MSKTFDYIVVGGGSAGCVAANRLSAGADHTVCLIEAGEDQEPMVHQADQWYKLQAISEWHWGITTPPQEHLDNRPIDCSQARLAGGCGSHNAVQYVRGSRFDYDGWAKDYGCSKWTWEEMLPFLAGLETYEEGGETRGTSGELDVRPASDLSPAAVAFIRTAHEHGLSLNRDYNNGTQYGISRIQTNARDGKRHGPFHAFIKPLMEGNTKRDNLDVRLNTAVGRVLFEGKRAVGVEIIDRLTGAPTGEVINATKDVVLAASALQSPKLLLLSGVGPRDHLESVGVPVVHDAPYVGQNLSDHLFCPWIFKFTDDVWSIGPHPATIDWTQVHMFAACDGTKNLHRPDLQCYFVARSIPLAGFPWPEPAQGEGHARTFTLILADLHPKSRGSVTLQSNDPSQPPLVEPNYLSDPEDVEHWRKMSAWMRELAERFIDTYPATELLPAGAGINDDVAWVKAAATTMWHPVGTLAMGTGEKAVVDPDTMKVKGVEGLRVVDASVIPEVTSGNTNVPAMVVGARAVDLLLTS